MYVSLVRNYLVQDVIVHSSICTEYQRTRATHRTRWYGMSETKIMSCTLYHNNNRLETLPQPAAHSTQATAIARQVLLHIERVTSEMPRTYM